MKKKIWILLVLVFIIGSASGVLEAAEEIKWMFEIDKAQQLALETNKDLLVLAKTDWDELSSELLSGPLRDSALVKLSNAFVCLQVSVLDKDFIKKYDITQYPTVIFLNSGGNDFKEIDRVSGLQEAVVYIRKMRDVLENRNTTLALKKQAEAGNLKKMSVEDQIKTLSSLGEVMINQSNLDDAQDCYEKLLKLDTAKRKMYEEKLEYIKALRLIVNGKIAEAQAVLEKLEGPDYEFELIKLNLIRQQQKEAFSRIDAFVNKYPSDERVPYLLDVEASYYFQAGRYKKGLDGFLKIISNYPQTPYAARAKDLIETMIVWPPRRQQLYQMREVENIVYIVPDIKTYLYYISLWDAEKIYPVLLEGSALNDKFIEAFNPKEVKNVRSVLVAGNVDEDMLYRALYTSWNDEDLLTQVATKYSKDDIKKFFDDNGHIPLGMVLFNLNSGEMAGGLALASARLQCFDLLPYVKKNERVVNAIEMRSLKEKVTETINSWQYPYKGLLDGIDYLTIAGEFPYAYDFKQTTSPGRYALDDALCRNELNKRDAYVGRLIGDFNESTYQAMCAIFLQPKDVLFFNAYEDKGTWLNYRTDVAAGLLSQTFNVTNIDKGEATLDRWHILNEAKGNIYDLVFINSSGGPSDWNLSGSQAKTEDIPDSAASIVIYTHSNSAANPYDVNTICGRWLKNGAYMYFGSVSEPYVQAFNTPSEIVADLIFGRPFSQSLRKDAGSWSSPWKLIFIGDPMYGLMPQAPRMDPKDLISKEMEN
jgi:tetratricopeptide (TPR) repeat protein